MRLTAQEVAAIKAAAVEAFGEDVVVRLFGSRVHDRGRGGDIDLNIETDRATADLDHEIVFRREVWKRLDEPQLDVVVGARDAPPRWIDTAAVRDGIVL